MQTQSSAVAKFDVRSRSCYMLALRILASADSVTLLNLTNCPIIFFVRFSHYSAARFQRMAKSLTRTSIDGRHIWRFGGAFSREDEILADASVREGARLCATYIEAHSSHVMDCAAETIGLCAQDTGPCVAT